MGSVRIMNTILMGGEDSPYQYTYTVELDRSHAVSYMLEPNMFREEERVMALSKMAKGEESKATKRQGSSTTNRDSEDDEEEEKSFYHDHPDVYLDPRDILLRQPGENLTAPPKKEKEKDGKKGKGSADKGSRSGGLSAQVA